MDKSDDTKAVDNSNGYELITWPNNELGFSILDKVNLNDNSNIFISPMSALFTIGMVYNGAEGDTKVEIAEALGLTEVSVDELNQKAASLFDILDKDSEGIELSIANSI